MKTKRKHAMAATTSPKHVDPVVEDFAQRQRRYHRMLLLAVVSWFLPIIAGMVIGAGAALGALGIPIALMFLLGRASKQHRCPSCGAKVVDKEGDETWSAPDQCLNCGVPLRYHDPLNKKKRARSSAIFATAFSLIFMVIGVALLIVFANARSTADESLSWRTVDGVIDDVRIAEQTSETPRELLVTYRYAIGGKDFRSNRISFGAISHAEQARRETLYKRGDKVVVYVNPDDPTVSVLQPGRQEGNVYLAIAAVVMLTIGAGVMWLGRKG